MKKSLITAVFTLGLIGNAFATCDTTPYSAPEELRPVCADGASNASDETATSADQIEAIADIESDAGHSIEATEKRAAKEIKSIR